MLRMTLLLWFSLSVCVSEISEQGDLLTVKFLLDATLNDLVAAFAPLAAMLVAADDRGSAKPGLSPVVLPPPPGFVVGGNALCLGRCAGCFQSPRWILDATMSCCDKLMGGAVDDWCDACCCDWGSYLLLCCKEQTGSEKNSDRVGVLGEECYPRWFAGDTVDLLALSRTCSSMGWVVRLQTFVQLQPRAWQNDQVTTQAAAALAAEVSGLEKLGSSVQVMIQFSAKGMVGLKFVVVLLVNLSPSPSCCLQISWCVTTGSPWMPTPLLGPWFFSLVARFASIRDLGKVGRLTHRVSGRVPLVVP